MSPDPVVLLLAGGLTYVPTRSVNLGDQAQFQSSLRRLTRLMPSVRIRVVASSLNEALDSELTELSDLQASYLLGATRRGRRSRVRTALRALLLLWNARRHRRGKAPRFLSSSGRDALRELAAAEALYVSGAGAFNDEYVLGVGGFWLIMVRAVHHLGKPVVLSGQQIGPLNRRLPRWLVRWGLNAANFIGTRDPISLSEVKRLGIKAGEIVLTGDDAWEHPKGDLKVAARIAAESGMVGPFVAAQLRLGSMTGLTADTVALLADALDRLGERLSLPILFLPMHHGGDSDDFYAANVTQARMKTRASVVQERLSPEDTKALISRASVAVGASYHFGVFALSAGTPLLGLYRTPYMAQKIRGLVRLCPEIARAVSYEKLSDESWVLWAADVVARRDRGKCDPAFEADGAAQRLRASLLVARMKRSGLTPR